MNIRIFSIGKATISLKADQTEHDELVRLREENEEIAENRRLINHFIGQA